MDRLAINTLRLMLDNYQAEEDPSSQFTFLLHVETAVLVAMSDIINEVKEGIFEHIDYRADMDNMPEPEVIEGDATW